MDYIIIFLKEKNLKTDILIDFLKGLLGNIKVENNKDKLVISYKKCDDINFNEITAMIVNDFYLNITLLEVSTNEQDYLEKVISLYNELEKSYLYLNDKQVLILSNKFNDEIIKKEVLKNYYNDSEMLHIIKVFFECDLNTTVTSQELFLHRNTLINKLDKFIKVTNYDIRKFKDAVIIYQLIN